MRILPAALLLGSLLAGAPAFAAETAALTAIDQGLSAAQLRSCPPPPAICDPDPGCTPSFDDCSRQLNAITFVRQKPNYVCVYRCDYTDTCHDTACGI
nr:hypothetical protein [Thermoanaerobaculia bacterium]